MKVLRSRHRDGLPEATGTWTDFTGYWKALGQKGISMNVISEVSFQQIRLVAAGYNPAPATVAQLERMKQLAARSMEEGAWGLVARFESGGPEHPEEVVEVAKVVAKYDGIYVTHIGSEGAEQDREIDFAIRVAQEAKIPVHIFHLKIRGEENWGTVGKYLAKIEAARSRGLDITANQYPYTAMQHGWSAFFPVWAREAGPQKFAAILKDPAMRAKIKTDKDFQTWVVGAWRMGWGGDGPCASAAQQEVRGHANSADRETPRRHRSGRHLPRIDGRGRRAPFRGCSTRCRRQTCGL